MQKIHHYTKIVQNYFKRLSLNTPIAIIVGSIIIATSIIVSGTMIRNTIANTGTSTTQNDSNANKELGKFTGKPIDDKDYVEGRVDSKVIIVEYSDPECPYCILAYPTIKKLREEYVGKIAFVYRHFPLVQLHSHAFAESQAIDCAGVVGGTQKYYSYMDALFEYKSPRQTQTDPSPLLPTTGKEDLARSVGIDVGQFSSCIKNAKSSDIINSSMNDGVKAGVDGTPTTFVLVKNGNTYDVIANISGAQQYPYFKAAVDEALSK